MWCIVNQVILLRYCIRVNEIQSDKALPLLQNLIYGAGKAQCELS